MNANWHSFLDKLNQALMKYTNQSICVFSFFLVLFVCLSNVRQGNVSRPTVFFINPLACFYLEVCILWELMIWNRFIIHFTTKRSRGIDMINWYLQAFNVFLMHLINCFPQTLSAMQSGYGSLQVLITQKCLNKQLCFFFFFTHFARYIQYILKCYNIFISL